MAVTLGNMPDRAEPLFVGRAREHALFQDAFERMIGGRRQVLLLLGEPGIGKTRCAEVFAEAAEEQGALALWGRCYEEPGAPPYWPWVQVLRSYLAASSESEMQLALGLGVKDIAALLPELGEEPRRASGEREAAEARFRTFDAVSRLFTKAAQQVPLLIVLDNLHWADAPSLSLLEFVNQELAASRIMLLGTYRDNEVLRQTPLLQALGDLSRDSQLHRLRLTGLDETAIASLSHRMLGRKLPDRVVSAINDQTDGNPLFVIELIKVLMEESDEAGVEPIAVRIPDGVRETIGRRVSRLSAACNELLTAASVLGRNFGADEAAAVADMEIDRVLALLEQAARSGIVEVAGGGGHYRFTHALIRETLYEEIGTLDRLRLHGRAGDAIAALRGGERPTALTRIAHHYFESATLGHCEKAIDFSFRAAEAAIAVHAYEDAVVHYDHVLSLLDLNGSPDDERIARACALKGQALLCIGRVAESTESLVKAIDSNHRLGDIEQLVDVASYLTILTSQAPQQQQYPLLERLLSLLPIEDSPSRATVIAGLAFATRASGERDRVRSLVDEALAIVERLGENTSRCSVLNLCSMALRGDPDNLPRRLELGARHLQSAHTEDSAFLKAEAYSWQSLTLIEAGELDACAELLVDYESLGKVHLGLHRVYLTTSRIALALLRGEWQGLEQRIEALRELGRKIRHADAEGVYSAQMFALNRERGRLGRLAQLIARFPESGARPWVPGLMHAYVEVGMLDEARAAFESLAADDFNGIPRDEMYPTCLVFCAETCFRLGDEWRARLLYDMLLPYADQTLNHPRAVCFGSAQLYLGMLARTANRADDARRHLEAAVQLNGAMRAWPWLARSRYHLGVFLMEARDGASARKMLRDAEELAGRLGMASLLEDIDRALRGTADRPQFPDELTMREVEVLRLLAMGRSNRDIAQVLSISLNTVATHVRNILNKTHCANRTEAAAYAMRHGLDQAGD